MNLGRRGPRWRRFPLDELAQGEFRLMFGRPLTGNRLSPRVVTFVSSSVTALLFFGDEVLPAFQPLLKFGQHFAVQVPDLGCE